MKTRSFNAHNKKSGNLLLLILHSFIIVIYTCRSLFLYFSISNFEYYLSFVLILFYVILLFPKLNKLIKGSKLFLLYISFGILCLLISFANNGLILSLMGFASIFLNMFLWMSNSIFSTKNDFKIIRRVFLICMVINAFVAIYQFYIDASFFGIISGLYGNESIMGQSNVTRRSVGFMGSPQSFSATLGVSLFVAYSIGKEKIRWPLIALFAFAGILSNSRAFGIAFILFLIFILIKMPLWKLLLFSIVGAGGYLLVSLVVNFGTFNIANVIRTFDFSKWAARSIYFSSLKGNSVLDWIIGKGYGLEGWNSNLTALSFDFSSTESYATSILSQVGLIGLMIYIVWIFVLLFNNRNNKLFFFMLIYIFLDSCFTPAFCGFAFSYIAWFAITNISKYGENLERGNLCHQRVQSLRPLKIY